MFFFKFWSSWARQESSLLNVLERWENEDMETSEETGSAEASELVEVTVEDSSITWKNREGRVEKRQS